MKTIMETTPRLYVPWDVEVAEINFGANCGPCSFAAITGKEVCRVMALFPHFENAQWTNLTQMMRAFSDSGHETRMRRCEFPDRGVALIQWLGPWTEKRFFSRWSLIHTHWVAVEGGWIYDYSVGAWQTVSAWQATVADEFISEIPGARGWAVKYGISVWRSDSGSIFSTGLSISSSEALFSLSP
jgi:hypothetical protein